MPPFLNLRNCNTEKECVAQACNAFAKLWFHACFQTASKDDCEKLIVWKDLTNANQTSLSNLVQMVHDLFDSIAGTDKLLAAFLKLSLKRAMSSK
jgi:hypothetical protein